MSELFKNLVHYVCWKVDDPSKLGATKLNKVLWYSDTIAYRLNGRPISGNTYEKRQYGPVPRHIVPTLRALQEEGAITIRERPYFNFRKRDFIALKGADESVFSEEERSIIDSVISQVCDQHTASSISELSHDLVWEAAEEGEIIPYYAVLAASPGEVTDAHKTWANEIIERLAA